LIEAAKTLEAQKKLERYMREETINRYNRLHQKAQQRGDYSSTHTGRAILNHVIQPFEDAIQKFVDDADSGKPGRRHRASILLKDIDVPTVAYLFTKAVLNYVPLTNRDGKTTALSALAIRGCTMIHDEMRIRYFEENHRALARKMLKDFDRRDLPRRRRKEMIQRKFGQLRMAWQVWDKKDCLILGVKLTELFSNSTGMVTMPLVSEQRRRRRIVQATPAMIEKISERIKNNEDVFTVYLPMLAPPKPWRNGDLFGGGYYTNHVTPYPLIKGVKRNFLEELSNMDLERPLAAINAIQETPYRISPVMPEILEHIFDLNRELAGLPLSDIEPIPEAPEGADEAGEVKNQYRRDCYYVHDRNRRRISKRLMVARVVHLAKKFEDKPEIYFPMQADSRWRLYPVPTYLNPQGPDFVKAMLEFAQGKKIETEEQAAWLAIIGANHFGMDKLPLQERADWTVDNQQMILEVAADPLNDLRWCEADEPFQFIRWAMEWSRFNQEGLGFVSHLPANVDATCSGMQIFSAALRDREGATHVNLTDTNERMDIYQRVADLANHAMWVESSTDKIQYAKAALDFGIGRKECKRPTMVVPYSGTFHACMKYVRDGINERVEKGEPHPMGDEKDGPFISYVAGHVWKAIDDTIPAARSCMKWLQTASRLVSKSEKPIPLIWYTPDGAPVQQARYEQTTQRVQTFLDGVVFKLDLHHDTDQLDQRRMASSVAPNWVHSLDGCILREAVNNALAIENELGRGRMYFNMIHDSYGVHCADLPDFLDRCIKPAFVNVFKNHDVLGDFEREVRSLLSEKDNKKLDAAPVRGDFEIEEVMKNDFFFS